MSKLKVRKYDYFSVVDMADAEQRKEVDAYFAQLSDDPMQRCPDYADSYATAKYWIRIVTDGIGDRYWANTLQELTAIIREYNNIYANVPWRIDDELAEKVNEVYSYH